MHVQYDTRTRVMSKVGRRRAVKRDGRIKRDKRRLIYSGAEITFVHRPERDTAPRCQFVSITLVINLPGLIAERVRRTLPRFRIPDYLNVGE